MQQKQQETETDHISGCKHETKGQLDVGERI